MANMLPAIDARRASVKLHAAIRNQAGHVNVRFWRAALTNNKKSCVVEQPTKVLGKQKQRDKSATTIAFKKWTAAIDSGHRIDPGARVPAPARPQEECAHRNPRN